MSGARLGGVVGGERSDFGDRDHVVAAQNLVVAKRVEAGGQRLSVRQRILPAAVEDEVLGVVDRDDSRLPVVGADGIAFEPHELAAELPILGSQGGDVGLVVGTPRLNRR